MSVRENPSLFSKCIEMRRAHRGVAAEIACPVIEVINADHEHVRFGFFGGKR
jgi:hypothetical protein